MSNNAMHQAARSNDLEGMQQLLVAGMHDVNAKDGMQRTPLHLACWAGHADMVKLLLRHHAKPGALAADNFTALHFAHHVEIIKALVKKDKHLVKARVSKGNKTALHLAIPKGNVEVVACLLDAGSDVTAKTGSGQTCLELAKTDDMYNFLKARYQERIEKLQQQHKRQQQQQGEVGEEEEKGEEDEGDDDEGDEGDGDGTGGHTAPAPPPATSSSSSSAGPDGEAMSADTAAAAEPAAGPDEPEEPSLLGVRKTAPSGGATAAGGGAASKRARMKASAGNVRLAHLVGEDGE
jgi:hypothetical protein